MTTIASNQICDDIGERVMANAIRFLAADAVQKANSGHPGMPMGMADVATTLFLRHLRFDPEWPEWPDRDRFVLSAGHGSMLLYALLYLTGYKEMTIDEIQNFRQLGSRTPGHPEYGAAAGIETTTGPLGQGLANAVGMALAERMQNARLGNTIVDHWTYVIAGDGCLMEGITHEAASLAGHLKLDRLVVFFDDNKISIDGPTSLSTSEDTLARFASLGWDVQNIDGHNPVAIDQAINIAKKSGQPSLIACQTIIGYGSPKKQGTSSVHGAPLGEAEIEEARKVLNWPYPPFVIPENILTAWRSTGARSNDLVSKWREEFSKLDKKLKAFLVTTKNNMEITNQLINTYKKGLTKTKTKLATRKASQDTLEILCAALPSMIGGSADLTGSNNTQIESMEVVEKDSYGGRYIHFGVREHAMAGAMNGIALHGGFIPYGGTFLVFTDYLRPSLRLSALMRQQVIYVMTHDSIGLGEDGPTHQPIEHLASLRAVPNLLVFRPADATEAAECWVAALCAQTSPSVLALTRQGLEGVRNTYTGENLCAKGAYELADSNGTPAITFLATGSEVSIALSAREKLQTDGVPTRVVSMPCWELFEAQNLEYKKNTLRPDTVRIAIEAGISQGWNKYIGRRGSFVGMKSFGESGPQESLYDHFGINEHTLLKVAQKSLKKLTGTRH